MAVKKALPKSRDREKAGHYILYSIHVGLEQAQKNVREHPHCLNWIEGITNARLGRKQLDAAWGEGGEKSSEITREIVTTHWPVTRERLMRIEAVAIALEAS